MVQNTCANGWTMSAGNCTADCHRQGGTLLSRVVSMRLNRARA